MRIQLWTIDTTINLNKFHEESYTKNQNIHNSILLADHKETIIPTQQVLIKHEIFNTRDGIWDEESHHHVDEFFKVDEIISLP